METMLQESRRIEMPATGELELRKERIDLRNVLSAAVDACRAELDAHLHVLSLRLPPEPVLLQADPARLIEVVTHLIDNAANYGGEASAIVVSAGGTSSEVTIRVAGHGIGSEAHTQARTEAKSRPRVSNLVRVIVELHDGMVEAVSSGLGMGSTFTVRMPRNG